MNRSRLFIWLLIGITLASLTFNLLQYRSKQLQIQNADTEFINGIQQLRESLKYLTPLSSVDNNSALKLCINIRCINQLVKIEFL
jgi:hypothetical protein